MKLLKIYCFLLLCIRFKLTVLPLNGYIHPDEYFQSVEVMAGDILKIKVHRSWEFVHGTSQDQHIRSVVFPLTTVGIPLMLLQKLSSIREYILGVPLLTPLTVIVFSRFAFCLLSLIIDWCMYRMCKRHGKKPEKYLLVLGSSYVTLIYFGRTLSNSIEAVLFALLIDTVSECICHKNSKKKKRKLKKVNTNIPSNFLKCTKISAILVIGIFNRPTFVLFALTPTLFWIFDSHFHVKYISIYFRRLCSLIPGFLIFGAAFVFADTWYYQENILIGPSEFTLNKIIITPWNFIKYNFNSSNLSIHGLHPWWTHILINTPLLFGPLIIHFINPQKFFNSVLSNSKYLYSIDFFMHCAFITPLFLLSLFPHQEPRFLIGLLFPIIFLNSEKIGKQRTKFFVIWLIFNVILCIFYGFLHQGGVIPSLNYLYKNNRNEALSQNIDVIYFHTYMPPQFMLFNKQDEQFGINVYDLKGAPLEILLKTAASFEKVTLVSPVSLRDQIQNYVKKYFTSYLNVTYLLHLSTEDPPPLNYYFFHHFGIDIQTLTKF